MLAKECGVNVEVENFSTAISGNNLKLVKNLFSFEIEEGKSDYFYNIVAKTDLMRLSLLQNISNIKLILEKIIVILQLLCQMRITMMT